MALVDTEEGGPVPARLPSLLAAVKGPSVELKPGTMAGNSLWK